MGIISKGKQQLEVELLIIAIIKSNHLLGKIRQTNARLQFLKN